RRTLLSAAGLGVGAALLAACGGDSGEGDGTLSVVTSAYPLAYLVTRIGGERISLVDLTSPGGDAHGIELSVKQVMAVEQAALVLHIPGLQSARDDAIAAYGGDKVPDGSSEGARLAAPAAAAHREDPAESGEDHAEHEGAEHEGHDHGPHDPHVWHDPMLMA